MSKDKEPHRRIPHGIYDKDGCKYKCKRSTKHIRLNIIDSEIGQNSPEWTQSSFDPLGSYTGVTANKFERPVQDVDDL